MNHKVIVTIQRYIRKHEPNSHLWHEWKKRYKKMFKSLDWRSKTKWLQAIKTEK